MRKTIFFIFTVFLCGSIYSNYKWNPPALKLIPLEKHKIIVIDGDTIIYNKQEIRFLGIDAPEIESPYFKKRAAQRPWGYIAKNFVIKKIQNALKVELIRIKYRDRYKRLLAYIIIDNKNLSALLAANALAYTYYAKRFKNQGLDKYRLEVIKAGKGIPLKFGSPEKWRRANSLRTN